MDNYFEPRQIIAIFLRWWWVLIVVTLITLAIGYGFTKSQTPVYKATTTVMVGGFIHAPQVSRDDIIARDAFTQAYADLALRQPVLNGVVETLTLDVSWKQLRETVFVEVVESTPLIEISAESNSPQDAQAVAKEVANQMILLSQNNDEDDSTRRFMQNEIEYLQARIEEGRERLATLQARSTYTTSPERLNELNIEIDTLQRYITDWEDTYSRLLTLLESNVSQNSLTIIEDAFANPKPVAPHLPLNMLLSAAIGFGLALGLIFVIDQFDDRIGTSEVLEKKLGLNHLGTITKMKGKNYDGKLISTQDPLFGTAIFYRKILNNIGFRKNGNRPVKSMLVTSPRLREGKSVTVSNLGIVTAQAGYKTIIVDVDWKKPVQHLLFDLSNDTGLMDLLITPELITSEQLQVTNVPNLQILTTGTLPENPVEVIQPKMMKRVLSDLAKTSDVVILDSPSTLITESTVLFGLVDGVILVIDSNHTTMTSVKQSMTSLYLTGGKLLGGILNRSPSWNVS